MRLHTARASSTFFERVFSASNEKLDASRTRSASTSLVAYSTPVCGSQTFVFIVRFSAPINSRNTSATRALISFSNFRASRCRAFLLSSLRC